MDIWNLMGGHPKNKSVLLGYLQSHNKAERVVIATYYTKFQLPVSDDYDDGDDNADWNEGEGAYYAFEGWYEDNVNCCDYSAFPIQEDVELVGWMEVPKLRGAVHAN